jgi:LysM repeat protein
MTYKTFTQVSVLILMLLAFFIFPISAHAGGCGSTYTVQPGDTLGSVANGCGITVYELYTANPGISGYLYTGQVLTIPDSDYYNNQNDNGSSNTYNNNYAPGNCPPSNSNCAANSNNGYNPYNNNYAPGNCPPNNSNCAANSYNGYNTYNNNYAPGNCPPNNYNCAPSNYNCASGNCAPGTYVVQYGDTFGDIANRFGVSVNDLWNANPNIEDENLLYPGQVINIPPPSYYATPVPASPWYASQPAYAPQSYSPGYGPYPPSYWYGYVPTPTQVPTPLSYGTVAPGAPMANIELSNKANADVYVSLQGTARDGTSIVREYQVYGTFGKTIPAGFYYYVAYIGGQEFSGAINLPGGSSHSLTFHSNEVDAQ